MGSWSNWKKTPEVNCSTSTIGDTTAEAPRPFFGTTENASPSSVQQARPSSDTQTRVNHWNAVAGSVMWKKATPTTRSIVTCSR